MSLIRTKGYAATSVDDLCSAAGVTKGAFFHHFKSKAALAVAAAEHWSEQTAAVFAAAPYHKHKDPLDRVLGYVDFRKMLLTGRFPEFTCLVGTMVQEAYETSPAIRKACDASINAHATEIEKDIAAAMQLHDVHAKWTPESLALHTQAVLQGAFILAKAKGDAAIAAESIDHLRRYIKLLFNNRRKGSSNMTTDLVTYLSFDGHCEAAFKHYEKILGGKILMMVRHADAPADAGMPQTPETAARIMHARLQIGERLLMGGDAPPQFATKPQGFCVSIQADDPAEAERIFRALGEGGVVQMPLGETFFAHRLAC